MKPATLVLLLAAAPVLAATPDFGVAPDTQRPAIGDQGFPSVAVLEGVAFTAWSDAAPSPFTGANVVVTRLDAAGGPLDAPGLTLPLPLAHDERPSLANCGGHLIATWTTPLATGATEVVTSELTVGTAGMSASAPVAVFPPAPNVSQRDPVLVSGAGECLLAWFENRLVATRFVTAALDAAPFAVSTSASPPVALAFDGTSYLAAWQEFSGDVTGVRVASDDSVSAPATWATGARAFALGAAAGTTLVVWTRGTASGSEVDGEWLDGAGVAQHGPTSLATDAGSLPLLAVAPFGAGFAVLAGRDSTPSRVVAVAVDAAGAVTGGPVDATLAVSEKQLREVALAAKGSGLVAAFSQDPRPVDGSDVHVVTFDAALAPGADTIVSRAASLQKDQLVATLGTTSLVAWTDVRWTDRGTPYSYVDQTFAARLDGTGAVLDSTGLALSTGANSDDVAGVSAGTHAFLVGWTETPVNTAWVRTVDAATGALGAPHAVSTDAIRGALAGYPGTHLFVARGNQATAVLLGDDGAARGAPSVLPDAFARLSGSRLVLATNGRGFLLARTQGASLELLPLDATGQPGSLVTLTNPASIVNEVAPTIASDGTDWFVTWMWEGDGGCITRLDRFDEQLTSVATAQLDGSCRDEPTGLAYDGAHLLTVLRGRLFGEDGHALGLDLLPYDDALQPVGTARLLEDGSGADMFPQLAPLPDGHALVSYTRRVDEAPFGTWRVRARVYPDPLPPQDGVDGGSLDGGDLDGGDVDGGSIDAGEIDAGSSDAGAAGGTPDGGAPTTTPGGCACGSTGGSMVALVLLALLLGRRRDDPRAG